MSIADLDAPPAATDRRSDQEERRSQIVAAANGLLGEHGLEGLTVRALLKRTGLARRAFYDGFPGKDDLVLAVFERVLRGAADHFIGYFATHDDPLECVHYFIYNIVLGVYASGDPVTADRRSAALSREHLRLADARPGELAQALRPLIDCLTGQVERGMQQGQMRPGDPALQARLIYNLLATTTHTELLDECRVLDRERREELAEVIWQFCRHAIAA
jgi:AcrR family transcriptional regulator